MKFFLDTEFEEDGRTIELISIGIVSEDGREYYAVNSEMDFDRVMGNPWLVENVVPYLPTTWNGQSVTMSRFDPSIKTKAEIRDEIVAFVGGWPEFWGFYCDYDWVVLSQLYGRMIDLPATWPMFCMDIKQWCACLGNPDLPENITEHHALSDARWVKEAWEFLTQKQCEGIR